MVIESIQKERLWSSLPESPSKDLLAAIRQARTRRNDVIVVLDDDPTGTQTVQDVPVLTSWEVDELADEIKREDLFYILTNSRSLQRAEAIDLTKSICAALKEASAIAHRPILLISRSDSTMRGHYPFEVDTAVDQMYDEPCLKILIPAFLEGGRVTVNDVHYVTEEDTLVPVAETPFAKDHTFGFNSSNLREYVEEKSGGKVKASDVQSISLHDLRLGGPEKVTALLQSFPPHATVVINAAAQADLQIFALAFLVSGVKAVLRTAASIVPVVAGRSGSTPLIPHYLKAEDGKGVLIVAGSYVPKTTEQLKVLAEDPSLQIIELDVHSILNRPDDLLTQTSNQINAWLRHDLVTLLYTSRTVITEHGMSHGLSVGNRISDFLVEVVRRLEQRPRTIIAKGGITSSDIATRALGIRRAQVVGQAAIGIPVWRTGPESKFPGIPYIVFPGNVGNSTALRDLVKKMQSFSVL